MIYISREFIYKKTNPRQVYLEVFVNFLKKISFPKLSAINFLNMMPKVKRFLSNVYLLLIFANYRCTRGLIFGMNIAFLASANCNGIIFFEI